MATDRTDTTRWALFYKGQRVSKAHSTERAVEIEAYERGGVVCMPRGVTDGPVLVSGYRIRKVVNDVQ